MVKNVIELNVELSLFWLKKIVQISLTGQEKY